MKQKRQRVIYNSRPKPVPVVDPPLDELGPAMRACTPMQRRFVLAIIQQRYKNGTQAARLAGYSTESEGGTRVKAHELIRHPKIIAAIHEEAGRKLLGLSMPAVLMLEHELNHGSEKARAHAIDNILDRTGFPRRMEKDVRVEDTRPHRAHEQLLALVYEKLKGHSIEVKEFKELPAPVEAQFKEVENVEGSSEVGSSQEGESAAKSKARDN